MVADSNTTPMSIRLPAAVLAGAIATLAAAGQHTAGVDVSALDRTIRPQDDLYGHANAAWLARTPIPPERVTYSSFGELSETVDRRLLAIVEEILADPRRRPGSPAQQIADLYVSITDEAGINARGTAPLQDTLDRIARIRTPSDLAAEAGHLSAIAAGGPFGGEMAPDPEDPRRLTVQIAQGGLLLPEAALYARTDAHAVHVRATYVEYLATLFRLLEREDPWTEAREVLALESALACAHLTAGDGGRATTIPARYTFRQLTREMSGFDWVAWGRPQGLTAAGSVVFAQPSFFKAFAALVPTVPIEIWQAWLRARYVTAMAHYVSDPVSDARFEFFGRFLTGQDEPRARWRRGVGMVGGYLADAVGPLYVRRHFPASSRKRVDAIAEDVRAAFREAIAEASWLSSPARRDALYKLRRLRIHVGHPDAWRDYRALVVRPDDLAGNVQRWQQFEHREQLARARGREDPRYWPVAVHSVAAVHVTARNAIILPAGLLQPPFFDPAADDAVNYGAIGGVIGHELSHAFDVRGRHFDGDGVTRDWWTPADEQAILGIAARLVEQADAWRLAPGEPMANGPDDSPRIDGAFTFAENAADLAGLSVAWRAWRRSLGGRPSPVIDGLTGEQRFFLGWAQAWRSKVRPEYVRQTMLTNPHAPAEFRVNGIVQHLDAFHAAFDVKPGDRLYRPPDARLRIW
jgi:putative endopeptidase